MRFIEVTTTSGAKRLVNVANITTVNEHDGTASIGITNGFAFDVKEPYSEIRSKLDTIVIEEAGL